MFKLNNPYYMYPNLLHCGYQNLEKYNSEVLKLYNYNEDIKNKKNILLSIIIGSPLEELKYFENLQKQEITQIPENYWEQLFPLHIREAIFNDINVNHIIISPSELFSTNYELGFIKNTKFIFEWKKTNNGYISENFKNIEINIFNCPMPSKYDYSNFLKKIEKDNLINYEKYQKKFNQTNDDIEFINSFYNNLGILFDIINEKNGLISCLSYAVFNNDSVFRVYNNYNLFKELIKLFNNKNNKKRILAEWLFDKNNIKMYIYNTLQYNNYLVSKKSFLYTKNIKNNNIKEKEYEFLTSVIYDTNTNNQENQDDENILINTNKFNIIKYQHDKVNLNDFL